jgi:hypothetical protein
MPCDVYKELENKEKTSRQRYAQYTYEENRHLRGASDRESKRIARDEKENMAKYGRQLVFHRENCTECQKDSNV